jgi:hypothetical protein
VDHREKSREEWEREFREDQYNIIPADGSRIGHIMAKRSSSPAPIPDFSHLIRGLVSGLLIAVAIATLSSNTPHKIWLSLALLTAGICLGITAFRLKQKSN